MQLPLFDDPLVEGLVVAQDPSVGAADAKQGTLTVARRSAVQFLSDLQPVADQGADVTSGTQKSHSIPYAHGILVDVSSSAGSIDYDLSRKYRQLVGDVGLHVHFNSRWEVGPTRFAAMSRAHNSGVRARRRRTMTLSWRRRESPG